MTALAAITPLSVGISQEFMRRAAPELAKDIVLQIGTARELAIGHYNLTDAQWDVLRQWAPFRALIAQAAEELAGPMGMNERIRRQARYALAMGGIADVVRVTSSEKTAAQHVLKGAEVLAEIAGVNTKSTSIGGQIASSGPLVSIVFSGGREVTVGVNPVIEGESSRVGGS